MLESGPVVVTGRLQPRRAIDEKDRVDEVMFLAEFRKEHLRHRLCSRRIQSIVEQAVRDRPLRAARMFVVEFVHGSIDRDASRCGPISGL